MQTTYSTARSDSHEMTGGIVAFMCGAACGAAMMYLMDPDRGAFRRHYLRDKGMRYARDAGRSVAQQADYRAGQIKGAAIEAAKSMRSEEISDDHLRERVRAEMGHHTTHAHDVDVTVHDGCVTLRGSIPAEEEDQIVHAVRNVRSVVEVDNQLSVR